MYMNSIQKNKETNGQRKIATSPKVIRSKLYVYTSVVGRYYAINT